MKHAKEMKFGSTVKTVLFFAVLAVLLVVSLALPLRPAESVRERRELVTFPKFSLSDLKDGTYFRGIESWFSDTFPGRDSFLELNKRIRDLYGIREVEVHGDVQKGDEIPDTLFTGK